MAPDLYANLGMRMNPFPAGASRDHYFQTESSKTILDELHYGVTARKGFLLLVGEVGQGKTSLLLQLLPKLEADGVQTSWVFNTVLGKDQLLKSIIRDFGLTPVADSDLSQLINQLHEFFLEHNTKGGNCAIIIDEAHNLDFDSMELLRMLSNLELNGEKLVQILLAGQPELKERMESHELRQFRSRVNIFLELPPLTLKDCGSYANYKLSAAGSQLRLEGRALDLVYKASGGNVRMLNLIMEKALYAMLAYNASRLNTGVIRAGLDDITPLHTDVAARLHGSGGRRGRLLAVGVLGCLALAVVLAISMHWLPLPFVREPAPEPPVEDAAPPAAPQSVPAVATDAPSDPVAGDPTEQTSPSATTAEAELPEQARGFLDDLVRLGLDAATTRELAPVLATALEIRNPDHLARSLPGEFRLAVLSALPPAGNTPFASLDWNAATGGEPAFIAVWRPAYTVASFYPNYAGEDIKRLQQALKRLGLYGKSIDGEVGVSTWKALAAFQLQQGLTPTGEPDNETLFWLQALDGDS